MICPIRFIRKPEESECIREKCGFWVDGSFFNENDEEPKRFTALLGVNKIDDKKEELSQPVNGKCSVLAIAEVMLKNKQGE